MEWPINKPEILGIYVKYWFEVEPIMKASFAWIIQYRIKKITSIN
jgi:hypothetical protein